MHDFHHFAGLPTPDPPAVVWHYTNADGLHGIVTKGKFFATHARYLNDKRELLHAKRILDVEVSRRQGIPDLPAEAAEALRNIKIDAARFLTRSVGVASFSACGDSLSQWRAYGGAAGFAIGFSGSDLFNQSSSTNGHFFSQCHYERLGQGGKVQEFLDSVVLNAAHRPIVLRDWRHAAAVEILMTLLKHHSFSDEHEWRYVVSSHAAVDHLGFRTNRLMVVPYYELSLAGIRILELRVGPTSRPDLSLRSAKLLLDFAGHKDALVTKSDTPYRTW